MHRAICQFGLVMVLVSLCLTTSSAQAALLTPQEAHERLESYGIAPSSVLLTGSATRASIAPIVVRAHRLEDVADQLKGVAAFEDTASHWASGYIAVLKALAEQNGETVGRPDGTFYPNGNVNAAETIAFYMKVLGSGRDNTESWPNDYLNAAVDQGFISAADRDQALDFGTAPVTNGYHFAVADSFFSTPLERFDGKSLYQQYNFVPEPTGGLSAIGAAMLLIRRRR